MAPTESGKRRTGNTAGRAVSPMAPPSSGRGVREQIRDTNPNTAWVHHSGFKSMYVFLVVAAWLFLRMTVTSDLALCWTAILQCHAIITFILFHWIKGAPEGGDDLNERVGLLTFWEQIDEGYFGTPTRRFLSGVPIVLFLVTAFYTGENTVFLLWNCASTFFCVVPKHEGLFGVRLFGLNAD